MWKKKISETNNNNSNLGDMNNLIEISETLPPSKFGFCTNCANLNKVCNSAKASRVLQWVEESRKYKFEIPLSIDVLKINVKYCEDNNEPAPLGKGVDSIDDIDE